MRGMLVGRLARRIIDLYPRTWRARYAAEALDLLQARAPTLGDAVNLALHLVYTHLHPDLMVTSEASLGERLALLMRVLRSSEIAIFWAFVTAMIAWLQFGGLVDGGPYMPLTGTAGTWPLVGMKPVNGISAALAMQSAAVDLAMLAVLAGGIPLAVAAWRRAPSLRWYFLVPVAAVIGALAPGIVALFIWPHRAAFNLTFESPLTVAYSVWFVGLAVV
ncbi:MAG TPA: hypothetical protein VGN32_21480, partial [Ktedonobacterales bacterium]|nr:hypothetical protein [Ktedonobacterales bacterium]